MILEVFFNLNDPMVQFFDCVLCCLERKTHDCASQITEWRSGSKLFTKVSSKKYKIHCKPEIKNSTAGMRKKIGDNRISHVSVSKTICCLSLHTNAHSKQELLSS